MQPSVLEVIAHRHINRHLYGGFKDNFKLGLVVEGGAMRSIISAGMLLALRDLKMLRLFDVFVGSSGGSLNLAYVLAGQGDKGLSIVYDHIVKHHLISPRRAMPGGEQVIKMKVLENIISNIVQLDELQLKKRYADKFYIAATNVDNLRGELISYKQAGNDFMEYLLAGATIPIAGGDYRTVSSNRYCDASLYYFDPLLMAEDIDCTHLLVLRTHNHERFYKDYAKMSNLQYRILHHLKPEIAELYHNQLAHFLDLVGLKSDPELVINAKKVYNLTPRGNSHRVGRLTTDPWKLLEGSMTGYEAVVKLFSKDTTISLTPTIAID